MAKSEAFFQNGKAWSDVRTGGKDALYWNQRLGDELSLRSVGFRRRSVAYNRWVYRRRTDCLNSLFPANRYSDLAVLDVGCGNGHFIRFWEKKGARTIVGLDITDKSIDDLKKKYPDRRFYRTDVSEPDWAWTGKFDVVMAFAVLYHITDQDRFCRAIANIALACKPDGLVVVTDLFPEITVNMTEHCCYRTLSDYETAFAEHGFELKELRPLFFTLLPPLAIRSYPLRWAGILLWEAATLLARWEFAGNVLGWLFYHIDSYLSRKIRKNVSNRMAVFVRRQGKGMEQRRRDAASEDKGKGRFSAPG